MVGELKNRTYMVSHQAVANILKRHNFPPTSWQKRTTTWQECIRAPWDLLVAKGFFSAQVWAKSGLVNYYI